jgi:sugar phosphate isomerase/epimerase
MAGDEPDRLKRAPRIGLCAGMLPDMSAGDFIVLAGRHGFSSLMFSLAQWLGDSTPASGNTRRLLESNGITRTSLDGVMMGLPRLPDAARRFVLKEDQYFRIADEIGARCFNVPHYLGDPATPIAEFVDGLSPICEKAARQGISLGLEFLPGTGIPDLATANRICDAVGAENLGVTIDTWHLARTGGTVADIRKLPHGRTKEFHISDRAADENTRPDDAVWGRLLPGEGVLPLRDTIAAVLENAPDVGLDAEIFSRELLRLPADDVAARVARAIRVLID